MSRQSTFYGLMRLLGEPHPTIGRPAGAQHFRCSLPVQPIERLKDIPGCEIELLHAEMAVLEIPIDGGMARIIGSVHVDEESRQTLREVTAFHIVEASAPTNDT